jgi:hypothetical protein
VNKLFDANIFFSSFLAGILFVVGILQSFFLWIGIPAIGSRIIFKHSAPGALIGLVLLYTVGPWGNVL